MKKLSIITITAVCAVVLTSCRSVLSVIPQATNTVATVTFGDLNLERKDYIVLNTASADATLIAHYYDDEVKIEDPDGDFKITWEKSKKTGNWAPERIEGIVRMGFLSNDYENENPYLDIPAAPHWIVRRIAIYRLINAAKMAGADGIIEPIISTNVGQGRRNRDVVLKTTVSGKLIKIKPDSK